MVISCINLLQLLCLCSAFIIIAAEFPLENPCLKTCSVEDITATILQKCIDQCMTLNHCCGNRLNGEAPTTSNMRLSCANGCEIAYYRSTVAECKADCAEGNQHGCEYSHPNIASSFSKCNECQEGCNKWPDEDACSDGCDFAANFPEFYQYEEAPAGTCEQDDIPRFLFSGQSNMEGWSEQALAGSFRKIVLIIHKKFTKPATKGKLRRLLNQAEASRDHTSRNEARILYSMRRHLKKGVMFNDHPKTTCSFTMPLGTDKLDCERPLSSTACGGDHSQYGPEFMFGHIFPKQKSPLKGKKVSITKVAVGGTIITQWMKQNKDEEDNYWYALADAIKGSNGSFEAFVWFQGESDVFMEETIRENYLNNLTQFIADVRQEILNTSTKFQSVEEIPVIIVELGYWIDNIGEDGKTVIQAQKTFVQNDPNAKLVKSGAGEMIENLSEFYHYDSASLLIVGLRIAKAMAALLRENAARQDQ